MPTTLYLSISMTDDAAEPRRWGRYAIIGAILLVLVAAGYFSARPAYRALKTWRAHRFVQQAETMIAERQWDKAYGKAQAALQLSPADSRSLRVMARILTAAGHEQALPFWSKLLENSDATADDRFETVAVALRTRQMETARKLLVADLQRQPVPPRTLVLASEYFAAQGNPGEAVRFAQAAVQSSPADPTNRFVLAQRLVTSQDKTEHAQGRAMLTQLAAGEDRVALQATVTLAGLPQLTPDEARLCIQKLTTHPDHVLAHEFLALDLQVRLQPEQRAKLFAEATRKYAAMGNEALVQLGRCFVRNREYDRVLEIIPATKAVESQDLFLIYADAVAGLGKWSELESVLIKTNIPLEPHLVAIYRVRVAKELGRDQLVPLYWAQAHHRASERPQDLLYLAQYAEKLGAHDEALKAYRRLTTVPQLARPAYLAMLAIVQQRGHVRDVRDLLRDLSAAFPNDAAAKNDLAYLNLLLDENVAESKEAALELLRQNPNYSSHHVTLALAHYRRKEFSEARSALERAGVADWTTAAPGWQALRAAVLGATGETDAARQAARAIPAGSLRLEERALIKPWL
jgi:tetratricopeptide (TPR) repeat protein